MADKDSGMEERGRGLFSRSREKSGNSPVEGRAGVSSRGIETSLPELTLTEVVKSPNPIVKVEPNKPIAPEDCIIQPYREYTIVLAKDSQEIQILDRQGRKIEGLGNTSTMILDWLAYRKGRKEDISEKGGYVSEVAINAFPDGQQRFVRHFLNKNKGSSNYAPMPSASLALTDLAKICAIKGNGYVLFSQSDSDCFIAFQTKNLQGIERPPRNWKRVDTVNESELNFTADAILALRELRVPESISFSGQTKNGFHLMADKDKLVVVKSGETVFADRVSGIGNNVCEDPKSNGVIYYCISKNAQSIFRLDTTKHPNLWETEVVELPNPYPEISNLGLDPTGNFFMFESGGDFVFLAKDNLQEAKRIPKLINAALDDEGRIRGIDEKGHLVIYDANFQEVVQEADKRRIARLAQGLASDLFKKEASITSKVEVEQFQHLVPVKTDFETQFNAQLQTTATLEDISNIREALGKLRTRLAGERLPPDQISFVTQGIEDSIGSKEHILAVLIVAQGLTDLNGKLSGNLTIALLSEAKGDLAKLKSMDGLVDDATRAQIRALENQFGQQSAELFRTQGAVIEQDVSKLVTGVSAELEKMTSMLDFSDWHEFTLPQLTSTLGLLANECPLEASETQKKILAARRQLQNLSRDYETRFQTQYALVREKASEVIGERIELMRADMGSFAKRLRGRGFKDRMQAETYVSSSEALGILRSEIEELARQNPDAARELDRSLKMQIANIMSEIERGGLTTIAETGQQMEWFGNTPFSKWEGKVKEKVKRQVDIIFMPDERSKGPGVSADRILGDIGIMEINSRGVLEKRRLYQGMQNEDEWRYGSVAYRGEYAFPSYVTQSDYRKIKQDYADWSREDESSIRKTYNEKRQALHDWYKQRQKIGQRDPDAENEWKVKYKDLLADYAKFSSEKHISLLNRIDSIRNAPETEFANGSGYVPEWANHWTTDEQTEKYLGGYG